MRLQDGDVDQLTYAIGDVHGRLDLLDLAIKRIAAHRRDRTATTILLGDYVDRGPDSRGVIELLMRETAEGRAVCLKGNHEDLMVRAIRDQDPASDELWRDNGGDATLRSYGGDGWRASDLDLVPDAHVAWMQALPTLTSDEHRIYVHAGLAPGVPAAAQDPDVTLWIRERFLRAQDPEDFPDGKHVVHGHTPVWAGKPDPSAPELRLHRTNLDTGAFQSGVLTVGVFDATTPGGPCEVLAIQKRRGWF